MPHELLTPKNTKDVIINEVITEGLEQPIFNVTLIDKKNKEQTKGLIYDELEKYSHLLSVTDKKTFVSLKPKEESKAQIKQEVKVEEPQNEEPAEQPPIAEEAEQPPIAEEAEQPPIAEEAKQQPIAEEEAKQQPIAEEEAKQQPIAEEASKKAALNDTTPAKPFQYSMDVLGGFMAAIGVAAVAVGFIALNAASFGTAGLAVMAIGAAATLAGVGLFAVANVRNVRLGLDTVPSHLLMM